VRETSASAFLKIVAARRGHFRLESGHHGALWLDLDPLFAKPNRIEPFVASLAKCLVKHQVSTVCGPMQGGAFVGLLVARALDVEFCFTERVEEDASDGLFQARYSLPRAFVERVRGKRVAIVDDVMSAGSSLRATYLELQAQGAKPVVAGALLALGVTGARFFSEQRVALEAVASDDYVLWSPDECPLCASGQPLEDVTATLTAADI
jgi:orotate phosphoribosyltransferase